MTWTRGGDSAATDPDLMKVAGYDPEDDRLLNEVAGFVFRCYFQVARHRTDYAVDPGTVMALGLGRWRELVSHATRAGLMTPVEVDGVTHWQMKADPGFMHVPTRAELEWAAQRKKDLRDPRLYVQVRLRDGDNCRWCGILVHWTGPRTNRSAELDHLNPGEPGTAETMVVACAQCNHGRGADVEVWDSKRSLRPAPERPIYGVHTAKVLTANGWPTEPNHVSDDDGKAPAGADTARPKAVRPATPGDGRRRRSKAAADPAPSATRSAARSESRRNPDGVSNPQSPESGLLGSGRDGSVTPPPTEGAPHEEPQAASSSPFTDQPARPHTSPRRRRGKRGGRRRPQTGGSL